MPSVAEEETPIETSLMHNSSRSTTSFTSIQIQNLLKYWDWPKPFATYADEVIHYYTQLTLKQPVIPDAGYLPPLRFEQRVPERPEQLTLADVEEIAVDMFNFNPPSSFAGPQNEGRRHQLKHLIDRLVSMPIATFTVGTAFKRYRLYSDFASWAKERRWLDLAMSNHGSSQGKTMISLVRMMEASDPPMPASPERRIA
jgi:hypothetical protein